MYESGPLHEGLTERYFPPDQRREYNMTLCVALASDEGIVLSADTQSTDKYDAVSRVQKIFPVGRYWALAHYGVRGVGEVWQELLKRKYQSREKLEEELVEDILKAGQRAIRETTDQDDLDNAMDQFIVAGYSTSDQPVIYYTFRAVEKFKRADERWATLRLGLIPKYWMERMNRSLHVPSLNIRQMERLAMFLIREAETQHSSISLPAQIAHITPEEGFEWKIGPPQSREVDWGYHDELRDECDQKMDEATGLLKDWIVQS